MVPISYYYTSCRKIQGREKLNKARNVFYMYNNLYRALYPEEIEGDEPKIHAGLLGRHVRSDILL